MDLKDKIATSVKDACEKKASEKQSVSSKYVNIFASEVVNAVVADKEDEKKEEAENKAPSKIDEMPPNKQIYFISLALRDIKNIIDVANFNLNGSLKKQKPVITEVYFNRDGSGSVDVTIPFEYTPKEEGKEDFSDVTGAFDLELRPEYKELVAYKVITPTVKHPEVSIEMTITLPKAYLQSIDATNFNTRNKVLTKNVEGLLKKELG